MKKVIKLINDERKNAQILSQKATNCIWDDYCGDPSADHCDASSEDDCLYIDAAHCSLYSEDICLKDHKACSFSQIDHCDYVDTSVCIGANAEDYS